VRTRELATVLSALREPAHVLHVVSRGDAATEFVAFNHDADRTSATVEELFGRVRAAGRAVTAAGIVLDAPRSGARRVVKAVRDSVAAPTAVVSAAGTVDTADSMLFAANFYAAFLPATVRPSAPHVLRAAERARGALRTATGRAAVFRGEMVTPR